MPSALWHRSIGSVALVHGNSGSFVMSIAYAGSRISAQLLCRNVTPIYKRCVSLHPCLNARLRSAVCQRPLPLISSPPQFGLLTAKRPTAVTTLLFSLSVKARSVDCAKLGSARVRPLPETCLGGILDVLEAGVSIGRQIAGQWCSQSQARTIRSGRRSEVS